MSLELGFVLAFAIIALGSAALTGFLLWLRSRENDAADHNHGSIKHG